MEDNKTPNDAQSEGPRRRGIKVESTYQDSAGKIMDKRIVNEIRILNASKYRN